jgi:TPR repeat protein
MVMGENRPLRSKAPYKNPEAKSRRKLIAQALFRNGIRQFAIDRATPNSDEEEALGQLFSEVIRFTGAEPVSGSSDFVFTNIVDNWEKTKRNQGSSTLAVETYSYLHSLPRGQNLALLVDKALWRKSFFEEHGEPPPGGSPPVSHQGNRDLAEWIRLSTASKAAAALAVTLLVVLALTYMIFLAGPRSVHDPTAEFAEYESEFERAAILLRDYALEDYADELLALADSDNPLGHAALAVSYAEGVGVGKNDEAASLYLDQAKQLGFGELVTQRIGAALHLQALIHKLEINDSSNPKLTIPMLFQAKSQGFERSSYEIARIYLEEEDLDKSCSGMSEAAFAAKAGHVDAWSVLGSYHRDGNCTVANDANEALSWIRQAAQRNHPVAQSTLADMHFDGEGGLPKSDDLAFEWDLRAANNGNLNSMGSVAWAYRNGRGTGKDLDLARTWALRAANQGHAFSQNLLGSMFEEGESVEQSDEIAAEWYSKAAAQNFARAQTNLGWMYENGRGVEQNDETAVEWYRSAAEQEYARAQTNLGWMYEHGRGVEQSGETAFQWYQKAADQEYARAQTELGAMYANGQVVEKNDEIAVDWFLRAGKQEYARAQANLGVMYREGRGVEQSDETAVEWYRKAAEQELAKAQNNLGLMYAAGRGVPQSDEIAVEWFLKAGNQEFARAQANLGVMYREGRGVEQSDETAVEWFRKAAEQQNARAQTSLGWMYEVGRGVGQSDEMAVEWYQKAAEQEYARAQANLGWMYEKGRGVEQSDETAVDWYRRAAEQGYAWGQYRLGLMYESGFGVKKQDSENAFDLFFSAAEKGDVDSQLKIASMYYEGRGVGERSVTQSLEWYRRAAATGNAEAKYQLAATLFEIFDKSPIADPYIFFEAIDVLDEAVSAWHERALVGKSWMLYYGTWDFYDIERDVEGAIDLLRSGWKAGSSYAAYEFADMYFVEYSMADAYRDPTCAPYVQSKFDADEVVEALDFAADDSNWCAINLRGALIEQGILYEQDLSRAISDYKTAADLGSKPAKFNYIRLQSNLNGYVSDEHIETLEAMSASGSVPATCSLIFERAFQERHKDLSLTGKFLSRLRDLSDRYDKERTDELMAGIVTNPTSVKNVRMCSPLWDGKIAYE